MNALKFAFISDNEVFHTFTFPDDPNMEGIISGLRSKPVLVEIPEDIELFNLRPGTKYIDGKFIMSEPIFEDDYEVED